MVRDNDSTNGNIIDAIPAKNTGKQAKAVLLLPQTYFYLDCYPSEGVAYSRSVFPVPCLVDSRSNHTCLNNKIKVSKIFIKTY